MRPYQFTLLRYVHNVSTEEFVNIGVLLWMPEAKKLYYNISDQYSRFSDFFDGFEGSGYKYMLRSLRNRVKEISESETLKLFNHLSDILPEILLRESGCMQWSSEMFGITDDAAQEVKNIFADMIARHEVHNERKRRTEAHLARDMAEKFRQGGIEKELTRGVEIATHEYAYKFEFGWQNGVKQVLEPISFDYVNKERMDEKVNKWIGRLDGLKEETFQMTGVVAPPQDANLTEAFRQAIRRLENAPHVRKILREDEIESFIPEIKNDIEASANY